MEFSEKEALIKQAVMDGDCDEIKRVVSIDGFDHRLQDSALAFACNHGLVKVARYLLDVGARPCESAVSTACAEGYLELLKTLVEFGEDLHSENYHCLDAAVRRNHIDVVQYYIEQGTTPADLELAFDAACNSKRFCIIDLLITHGVSMSQMDQKPIYLAVKSGQFDLCAHLLEHVDAEGLLDCKKAVDVALYIDKENKEIFYDIARAKALALTLEHTAQEQAVTENTLSRVDAPGNSL